MTTTIRTAEEPEVGTGVGEKPPALAMTEMLLGSRWLWASTANGRGARDRRRAFRQRAHRPGTRRGSRREPRRAIALHARAGKRPSSPIPTGDDQS